MGVVGVEPTRGEESPKDFKSFASAIPPHAPHFQTLNCKNLKFKLADKFLYLHIIFLVVIYHKN